MFEPVDDNGWRRFRILMKGFQDAELKVIAQHLKREMKYRQDCDSSLTRLFFSSLSVPDLERAAAELRHERNTRLEVLRIFKRGWPSGISRERKQPQGKAKGQGRSA